MTDDACQRYTHDPEAHAGHLAVCEKCREIDTALSTAVAHRPISVEALPLAPWEQATYRAWPLVVIGALAVLAIAFALCFAAGISLLRAIVTGMSAAQLRGTITIAADALRRASLIWHVAFGFCFFLVNTVLVLLLRRAPRGIDA
jgi:hypothetical protein